jgi:hypothetical protein
MPIPSATARFTRRNLIAAALVAAACPLLVGAAPLQQGQTSCKLGLNWELSHANGNHSWAEIDQVRNRFSGTVVAGAPIANGTLFGGIITGRRLTFRVRWSNGHTGVYDGYIYPDGRLQGANHDIANPNFRQRWSLKQRVHC